MAWKIVENKRYGQVEIISDDGMNNLPTKEIELGSSASYTDDSGEIHIYKLAGTFENKVWREI